MVSPLAERKDSCYEDVWEGFDGGGGGDGD